MKHYYTFDENGNGVARVSGDNTPEIYTVGSDEYIGEPFQIKLIGDEIAFLKLVQVGEETKYNVDTGEPYQVPVEEWQIDAMQAPLLVDLAQKIVV